MSRAGQVVEASTGRVLLRSVVWCASFGCKLRGLMFRRGLADGEGLLFVERRASRTATSIHMFFVSFPIAVVWLDEGMAVVDKVLAKPWRPAYAPRVAAQYTLEASPALLDEVAPGDRLEFREDAPA